MAQMVIAFGQLNWPSMAGIKDSPSEYAGEWSLYIPGYHTQPPTGEYSLPKELYLEVPANNRVTFDFLGSAHRVKIVSESLLQFLVEHGITSNYEIAAIGNVISRKGKVIETPKKYFALRFYAFDDDLLDFQDEVVVEGKGHFVTKFSIYPNMSIKEGVDKRIFVPDHPTFSETLIFTEEIKHSIEEKGFIGPEIYTMTEFQAAFID